MKQNLTSAEKQVLVKIAYDEYSSINGAKPESKEQHGGTFCCAEDLLPDGMNVQQTKGVLSSLVKKGLILIYPEDDQQAVDFTDEGFAAFLQADSE